MRKTTQAERLHMALLSCEHPWVKDQDRRKLADVVCCEARRLLREQYGLEGDWPCDMIRRARRSPAAQTPSDIDDLARRFHKAKCERQGCP